MGSVPRFSVRGNLLARKLSTKLFESALLPAQLKVHRVSPARILRWPVEQYCRDNLIDAGPTDSSVDANYKSSRGAITCQEPQPIPGAAPEGDRLNVVMELCSSGRQSNRRNVPGRRLRSHSAITVAGC